MAEKQGRGMVVTTSVAASIQPNPTRSLTLTFLMSLY